MAKIPETPGWRNIQMGTGTGSVGVPRTTPADFGAESWRNLQRLGNQVTESSVQMMRQFIRDDHQRQEDEAKEDLLMYDTRQQKRVDELMQRKTAAAFDTPEMYIEGAEADQITPEDESRREGELYKRMLAEGRMRIDQHNVQRLNRHVLNERTNLRVQAAEASSARAIEVIKQEPWRLNEQLNVIFDNIDAQVEAQGLKSTMVGSGNTAIYMADFYKQQALTGAVQNALTALATQYGPEEALTFLRSNDAQRYRKELGEGNWNRIFGAAEKKLQAEQAKQAIDQLTVQLDSEINSRYMSGEDPAKIRAEMVQKYGTSLGVPAVNALARSIFSYDRPEAESTDHTSEYRDLLMAGNVPLATIEWSAQMRGAQGLKELRDAQKEVMTLKATGDDYRVHALLNEDDSPIAQQLKAGNYEGARRTVIGMRESLSNEQFKDLNTAITSGEKSVPATESEESILKAQLDKYELQKKLVSAQEEFRKQELLDQVMSSPDPQQSEAYMNANYKQKAFIDKELAAMRASQYESDQNTIQRNFYAADSLTNAELNALMSTEQGMTDLARSLGGFRSQQFQDLWKKSKDPSIKTTYTTRATTEARNAVRAAASKHGSVITNREMQELGPIIDDSVTEVFNDYQESHNLESPAMIPPSTRRTLINGVVYKTLNNRAGLVMEASGTSVDEEELRLLYPEIVEQSIRVSTPDIVRAATQTGREIRGLEPLPDEEFEAVPPVWTFKEDRASGISTWVQENIPYGPGIQGDSAVKRISGYAMKEPDRGRLCFFPEFNSFALYDNAGRMLIEFDRNGNPKNVR